MQSPRHPLRGRDEGFVLVLVAFAMVGLLLTAAIVVDLAALRTDRRADQRVADAASTAAAIELVTNGRVAGCEAARDYAIENLPGVSSLAGFDCSGFADTCDVSNPDVTSGSSGDVVVSVTNPVPDDHALMVGSAIGAPARAVVAADGPPCERIGVAVHLTRRPFFAGVGGHGPRTTRVHSVALARRGTGATRPLNLLILERRACDAIWVHGGGSGTSGLVVLPVTDGTTSYPGTLASDSDGTVHNCPPNSNSGTLNVDGSSGLARADGPTGCGFATPDNGEGCGIIELFAEGVPGDANGYCTGNGYLPACQSSGTVRPHPGRMTERRTRAPIDHRYNCKASYANEPWFVTQPIDGCSGGQDYIDDLESYVAGVALGPTAAGWNVYGDSANEPCTIEGGAAPTGVAAGNWFVQCSRFIVKLPFTFRGGNVIFDGDVVLAGSNGALTLNRCDVADGCPADVSFTPGNNFSYSQYSADAAWVVFRNHDGIRKGGQASLRFDNTMVLLSDTGCEGSEDDGQTTSRCSKLEGGSGPLLWSAPTEGPFDDLSLWSEGTLDHSFAGQAGLNLEGVFFVPVGKVLYAGNGAQVQVSAQFLALKLEVTGGGLLMVRPLFDRAVLFPEEAETFLIR